VADRGLRSPHFDFLLAETQGLIAAAASLADALAWGQAGRSGSAFTLDTVRVPLRTTLALRKSRPPNAVRAGGSAGTEALALQFGASQPEGDGAGALDAARSVLAKNRRHAHARV